MRRGGVPSVAAGCALVMLGAVLSRAWVCDDAYLTFRTVMNAVHGDGFVYNLGHRVQVYTHPLWMLGLAGVTAVVREPWLASMLLSLACVAVTAWLLLFRLASSPAPCVVRSLALEP